MPQKDFFDLHADSGIAHVPDLSKRYNLNLQITWDNSIWGNMNPNFAVNDYEKDAILQKDVRFSHSLGANNIFVAQVPHEGTVLTIDQKQLAYFQTFGQEYTFNQRQLFFPVSSNGFIVTESNVGVVFAPRDCAIFILVHPDWPGFACFHVGAMQAAQDYQEWFMQYLSTFNRVLNDRISECEIWITPHICPEHYCISDSRADQYLRINPELKPFLNTPTDLGVPFDFVGYTCQQLKNHWDISKIHHSNICNYASAQNGMLYSRTLSKQYPQRYSDQGFNVGVARPT